MNSNPHIYHQRVYAEDTDFMGVVYHANYLKYIERARTEYLRQLGIEQDALYGENILFVINSMQLFYFRPAQFNDMLKISTTLVKARRVSLIMHQRIECDAVKLFEAKVKIGCVNKKFKIQSMPKALTEEEHQYGC